MCESRTLENYSGSFNTLVEDSGNSPLAVTHATHELHYRNYTQHVITIATHMHTADPA